MAAFMDGAILDGVEAFGRAADLFEDLGNVLRVVTPRHSRAHGLAMAGFFEEATTTSDAALDAARSLANPESEAFCLWQRADIFNHMRRPEAAYACADEAVQITDRIGHRGWGATAHLMRGIAQHLAGELDAAEDDLRATLGASEHLSIFASWARARLALLELDRGHPEEALTLADQSLTAGAPLAHYIGRLARARATVMLGLPEAPGVVRDALERARAGGYLSQVPTLEKLLV